MSCDDCGKLRNTMRRLRPVADAHGYELWTREGPGHAQVLAIPSAASHGTPEAFVALFAQQGLGPVKPPAPGRPPRRGQIPRRSTRNPEAGHISYILDGPPPVELIFINKLL